MADTVFKEVGAASRGALANAAAPSHIENNTVPLSVDLAGNLRVNVSGGATGGTSVADESAFSEGTTLITPIGGEYNAAPVALASGQTGAVEMTANRAFHVNLRKADGTEEGILAAPLRVDPTGTTVQPVSFGGSLPAGTNLIGKVGIDQTTPGTTNRVDIGNIPHVVVDTAPTTTVTGTVTANAGTNLNTSLLALEAGGNLANIKAKTDNLDVLLSTRLKPADTLAAVTSITNPVGTNADTTISGTVAPAKELLVAGKTNDGTPQYQPIPEGTGGRSVIVEGVAGGTTVPVSGTVAIGAGAAVIGHVIVDTAPTTTVQGGLTNNNAVPAATNVGVLPAVASAAAPTYVEGNQVLLSTTLAGSLRSQVSGLKSTNSQNPGSTNLGVLAVVATAAAPSFTEGFQVTMSSDLSGGLRVASLPAGANVIGHVIVDSGAVTTTPATVGQSPMAASVPVVVASDQVVPTSDNITQIGSQPFSLGRASADSSIPVVIAGDSTPLPVTFDAGQSAGNPLFVTQTGNVTQPVSGSISATQLGNWVISLIQGGAALSSANPLPVQLSDGVASYDLQALLRTQRMLLELESTRTSLLIQQTGLFVPQSEYLPFLGA